MRATRIALLIALALPLYGAAKETDTTGKQFFFEAKTHLENMLSGKEKISYEEAIFQIENAWWEGRIDRTSFDDALNFHEANITNLIKGRTDNNTLNPTRDILLTKEQKRELYRKAVANWAVFQYMTNNALFVRANGDAFLQEKYSYSTNDPLGTIDWANTQIIHLLQEHRGNCFALASLYKILSERLGSDARLCTAPGHIYIRHADDKGTYYNVELSSRSFPGTGTIETLTYSPNEAVRNGIALRELDLKQSVALCLVYLAKGYEYKFGSRGDEFLFACAETALRYDAHNLNALLLKAEVMEERLFAAGKQCQQIQETKAFQDYQNHIRHLFKLGYREMPQQMKNILIKGWMKDTTAVLARGAYQGPHKTLKNGMPATRYASLSWGLFDEEMRIKPIEIYGRTHFDTKKQMIVKLEDKEPLYNNYGFDPVVFAWQVDPLAHKFPWQSPYCTFDNDPINKIDPDGQAGEPVVKNGQLFIYSDILFYGGAATPQLANAAASNMAKQWTNANGTVTFKGTEYRNVTFVVTAKVVSEETAKNRADANQGENFDPRLNFARIESKTTAPGVPNQVTGTNAGGDNSFFLLAEDIYPENTSQAHEYGHGVGIMRHVSSGQRFSGQPRIMTTIQTLVDAPYTMDGQASQPQGPLQLPLHILDANCRVVTQADINGMKFRTYKQGMRSGNQVGASSNVLFDEKGKAQDANSQNGQR